MGKLMYESSGLKAIFIEESYGLQIYFDLESKIILINSLNKQASYHMSDIPVSYGSILLPVWNQVLLGMTTERNGIESILEVHKYYLDYESEFNTYENDKLNNNVPDINFYFSDENKDNILYDLVIQSNLNYQPLCLVLEIQKAKVHIYYDGKKLSYNLDYLPYKYFQYLQPSVFDAIDSHIRRLYIENPQHSLLFLTIRTNWLELKKRVEGNE